MQTPKTDTESGARFPFVERLRSVLRGLFRPRRRLEPIRDPAALRAFLQTRAFYVAQMTLYGYLRTRAGVRFPELFEDDQFVASTNIAKWHVWLACLSDLAVHAGRMMRRNSGASDIDVSRLMRRIVNEILAETGTPAEAGAEFVTSADRLRVRIGLCDWSAQSDGEQSFVESPSALVHWAPIVDDLKALDEEIVRNSVRFRWHEIRQQLQRALDAVSVMSHRDGGIGEDPPQTPTA